MFGSNPEPLIRPIGMNDLEQVAALYREVFNAPPWNDAWTDETAYRRLTDTLQTPQASDLLLWLDGVLVGVAMGYQEQWFDGSHYYLKEMFIRPDRQRHGLGRHLMEHLKRMLADQGVSRIYLLTERVGVAAEFYKQQGFYVSERMALMACPLSQE